MFAWIIARLAQRRSVLYTVSALIQWPATGGDARAAGRLFGNLTDG